LAAAVLCIDIDKLFSSSQVLMLCAKFGIESNPLPKTSIFIFLNDPSFHEQFVVDSQVFPQIAVLMPSQRQCIRTSFLLDADLLSIL